MDNYFITCPAMMNDQGRHIADFSSPTRRNENIKLINNIHRDDDYRVFLQNNGENFMDREWLYLKKNTCYVNTCVHKYSTRQTNAEMAAEKIAYDNRNNPQYKNGTLCVTYRDYRLANL